MGDLLENSKLATFDIWIIAAYLLGCIFFGFYKTKGIKNIKQYSIGSGSFPTSVVVATIFATFIGADMTIGIIGQIYSAGLVFVLVQMIAPGFWLVAAKVFGENIDKFRGCISISDIMNQLYGKVGRWVTNISAFLFSIGFVAVQAAALGHMFHYLFPQLSYQNGVILAMVIMITYSFSGGIKAVAMTDVFQFLIFFIAIPVACIVAYHDVGGFENMKRELPEDFFSININKDNMWMYISLFCVVLIPDPSGIFMQRFLITKSSTQLKNVLKIVAVFHFFFICVLSIIAYVVRTKAPEIDPDTAVFYLINHYLPVGVIGLMIAGMLAVIMSSADSWLNTTSILCAHDIIKSLFPNISESKELMIAKISTVVIGMCSICLALLEGKNIFYMMFFAYNFWFPIILIPLSAGFMGLKANTNSFVISVILSIGFTVYVGSHEVGYGIESMMAGILGSTLGLFGSRWLQNIMQR